MTLLINVLWVAESGAVEPRRFVDNRDGTVTDNSTSLTWVKNPESVETLRGGMIWLKARDACRDLVYAGKGPNIWRLPDIDELQTILSDSGSPRVDSTFFVALPVAYWTTTAYSGPGANAWVVNFANGDIGPRRKLNLLSPEYLRARCVRD